MVSIKSLSISIESFDGRGDFTLCQQWVNSLLTREGTIKALKVKIRMTEKMVDDEWVELTEKDKPEKTSKEE